MDQSGLGVESLRSMRYLKTGNNFMRVCISKLFCMVLLGGFVCLLPTTVFAVDDVYSAKWNAFCGYGQDLQEGCDAIRARKLEDSSTHPKTAMGRVNYRDSRYKGHCTGTMISDRHVLTAGRCVFNQRLKQFFDASDLYFEAGYDRGESIAGSLVSRYLVSDDYRKLRLFGERTSFGDWAILELEKSIGDKTGFVSTERFSNKTDALPSVTLLSYPEIRAHVLSSQADCEMKLESPHVPVILHSCPIMEGDSGAPMILSEGDKTELVAISVGGSVKNNKPIYMAVPVWSVDWKTYDDWLQSD